MISNKKTLRIYLEKDRKNNKISSTFKNYLFSDTWRFLRLLRKAEYYRNVRLPIYLRWLRIYTDFRFKAQSKKLGYSIPPNVCGPGLMLPHYGNIIINRKCKIGENCRIHVGVNIGAGHDGTGMTPQIGNNCYIAPGAKIFGGIKIADNVQVGANAVVNKSFEEPHIVIAGIPAKIIKKIEP
ncbi:serine O-acetyltransferase [Glaciecola sp. 1036]|uniref:serine O-acetyltransferase n=1 Tax=Alteromonadaceae TaxID=72275 RepID=UPI003D037D77